MSTVLLGAGFVLGLEHNGVRLSPAEFDAVSEFDELHRVKEHETYRPDLLPGFEIPLGPPPCHRRPLA